MTIYTCGLLWQMEDRCDNLHEIPFKLENNYNEKEVLKSISQTSSSMPQGTLFQIYLTEAEPNWTQGHYPCVLKPLALDHWKSEGFLSPQTFLFRRHGCWSINWMNFSSNPAQPVFLTARFSYSTAKLHQSDFCSCFVEASCFRAHTLLNHAAQTALTLIFNISQHLHVTTYFW